MPSANDTMASHRTRTERTSVFGHSDLQYVTLCSTSCPFRSRFDETDPFVSSISLLKSGEHSDCQIVCIEEETGRETRTFNCHKAIISRSDYFSAMLAHIAENEDGGPGDFVDIIQLYSPDAEIIETVLNFIYSGGRLSTATPPSSKPKLTKHPELDFTPLPGHSILLPYLLAFQMGHEFGVHGLADYATTALGNHLSPILAQISDQRNSEPFPNRNGLTRIRRILGRNDFVGAFLSAVEAADEIKQTGDAASSSGGSTKKNSRLRPYAMMVDFFIAGKEVLLREPQVQIFLKEEIVPSFARAVLMTEAAGYRSAWMHELMAAPPEKMPGKKGMCFGCGESLRTGGTAAVNPKSKRVVYSQACCHECADKEENVEVHGRVSLTKWAVFNPKKK